MGAKKLDNDKPDMLSDWALENEFYENFSAFTIALGFKSILLSDYDEIKPIVDKTGLNPQEILSEWTFTRQSLREGGARLNIKKLQDRSPAIIAMLEANSDIRYHFLDKLFLDTFKNGPYSSGGERAGSAVSNNTETASSQVAPGGIDFDPTLLNLQIKRDGKGVPLPLPQQNIENINIEGLFPVIINIQPVNPQMLPLFLGQAPRELEAVLSKN